MNTNTHMDTNMKYEELDINALLKGVSCTCGRIHKCDIKSVFVEKDAISRLRAVCEGYKSVLIVADENTYFKSGAGEKVASVLSDRITDKIIYSGKALVIPNEESVSLAEERMIGKDLIIGIGSGVIQDICKYISHKCSVPYVIVATAPSMDGYASTGAAMIMGGMKVTYSVGLPMAIIADTDILKNAPIDMIKAGYGDIIGKYSALNDWQLSHIVNGEYFCPYIYDMTLQAVEKTVWAARNLPLRDENGIRALTEALITVGIMMSFAGSSRPASGSEHHLSHFFELVGILNKSEYLSHGIDVAYSTVITSRIREEIAGAVFPASVYREEKEEYERRMREIYSSSADATIALQERVGFYDACRSRVYLSREEEIKATLKNAKSADEITELLSIVGLDIRDFYSLYGEDKIMTAVKYAKDLKDRYTVLWLYYDLFGK